METSRYTKLDPTLNEIRLFKLKPSASGSNIEGLLESHSLLNSPSY